MDGLELLSTHYSLAQFAENEGDVARKVWLYGRYEHVLDTPRASLPLVQLGYHKPCRTNKTRRTGLQAHGMAWQSSWYWVWS
jgi:hypothetical protein